jgi:hypothetical protein
MYDDDVTAPARTANDYGLQCVVCGQGRSEHEGLLHAFRLHADEWKRRRLESLPKDGTYCRCGLHARWHSHETSCGGPVINCHFQPLH